MRPGSALPARSTHGVAVWLSIGLVAWSAVANLVIGDTLYTTRNLLACAVLVAFGARAGLDRAALGLDPQRLSAGLHSGAVAATVIVAALLVAVAVQDHVPGVAALLADERAQQPRGALVFAVLVRIPLGTALFEELAFRGVLLALWWRVAGPRWAMTWSSVTFGLWHVAPTIVALRLNEVAVGGAQGVLAISASVVATTVAGVVFVWLRGRSGSLLAPIIAHWAINACALLAAAAN